jgi:hypothetical protein
MNALNFRDQYFDPLWHACQTGDPLACLMCPADIFLNSNSCLKTKTNYHYTYLNLSKWLSQTKSWLDASLIFKFSKERVFGKE